ncbi:MAG: hypothetical protein JNJ61_18730 [Anaerolineae bacterium]|nr:hypothetical protein [Anaerolineae bacterium]
MNKDANPFSNLRFPLFGLVIVMMLAGGWAALQRAGWSLPVLRPTLIGMHGPLMIGGLFGTLISLERAVAVAAITRKHWHWSYIAPGLSAFGGLVLLLFGAELLARFLLLAGSSCLVLIYAYTATKRHYWSLHTVIMCAGAGLWAAGNLLWLVNQPLYLVVHSWIAFLALTIVGERLELSRVGRLTHHTERLLIAAIVVYFGGVTLVVASLDAGVRLAGLGQLLVALWLLRFDIAGRSVRLTGLTRYIAVCLLTGYLWLAVGGILGIMLGAVYAGFNYDAVVHAVLAGFVFSMVFGHAPLIIPALTGRQITYRPIFYVTLALLHVSVLLREYSNLIQAFDGRKWAGMINAVAVLSFIALLIYGVVQTHGHSDAQPKG